jgi:hypothetical protein
MFVPLLAFLGASVVSLYLALNWDAEARKLKSSGNHRRTATAYYLTFIESFWSRSRDHGNKVLPTTVRDPGAQVSSVRRLIFRVVLEAVPSYYCIRIYRFWLLESDKLGANFTRSCEHATLAVSGPYSKTLFPRYFKRDSSLQRSGTKLRGITSGCH